MNTINTDCIEMVVRDTISVRTPPLAMRIEGIGKQYNQIWKEIHYVQSTQ